MSCGECLDCGHPTGPRPTSPCPKCGASLARQRARPLLEIDIAHHGETIEVAREKLLRALDEALRNSHAGLKVIHGRGNHAGRPTIAAMANALLRAQVLRHGGRLTMDRNNPGASILWLNR